MILHVGDQVEVDRLGMPFHKRWGIVHQVEELVVWVRLVEYSRVHGAYALTHPMKFETWELLLLERKEGEMTW